MRILLIGPPGVGKGTQAALLKERLGLTHLASGDIFRNEVQSQSELGRLAKSYMDLGELVPDEVTIEMMAKQLLEPNAKENGFILDGFPRTVAQAGALARLLETLKMPLDKVVVLDLADQTVMDRLTGRLSCPKCGSVYHKLSNPPKKESVCDKCGNTLVIRADDCPDTVRERLRVYRESTAPVIEHYSCHGTVLHVDAAQSPEQVLQAILDGI